MYQEVRCMPSTDDDIQYSCGNAILIPRQDLPFLNRVPVSYYSFKAPLQLPWLFL